MPLRQVPQPGPPGSEVVYMGVNVAPPRRRMPWKTATSTDMGLSATKGDAVDAVAVTLQSSFDGPWRRTVGVGAGRRAVEVRKAIHVAGPVAEVSALWSDLDSSPGS